MFVLDAGLFLGSLLGAHEALEIGSWMPDGSFFYLTTNGGSCLGIPGK
jgi:hypothetical protein